MASSTVSSVMTSGTVAVGRRVPVVCLPDAGGGADSAEGGDGDDVLEFPKVLQGFVEQSNVSPVAEFAKLIMAQRYFEAGQNLAEQEHQRLSSLIDAIRTQG